MLRTFASACSYPSGPCFGGRSVAMLMLQLSCKPWVTQGQQWHFLQLPEISPNPHAADSQNRQNIHYVKSRTFRIERRHNEPVHVHKTENDEHSGNKREPRQLPLHAALQEEQERQREM